MKLFISLLFLISSLTFANTESEIRKLAQWKYADDSAKILMNGILDSLQINEVNERRPFEASIKFQEYEAERNRGNLFLNKLHRDLVAAQAFDPVLYYNFIRTSLEKFVIKKDECAINNIDCEFYAKRLFYFSDINSVVIDNEIKRIERPSLENRAKTLLKGARLKSNYFKNLRFDHKFSTGFSFKRSPRINALRTAGIQLINEGSSEQGRQLLALVAFLQRVRSDDLQGFTNSADHIAEQIGINPAAIEQEVILLFSPYEKYLPTRVQWLHRTIELFGPEQKYTWDVLNLVAEEMFRLESNDDIATTILTNLNNIKDKRSQFMVFSALMEFIHHLALENSASLINRIAKPFLADKRQYCEKASIECFDLVRSAFQLAKVPAQELKNFYAYGLVLEMENWEDIELADLAKTQLHAAEGVRYFFEYMPKDMIHGRKVPENFLKNDFIEEQAKEMLAWSAELWDRKIDLTSSRMEAVYGFVPTDPNLYALLQKDFEVSLRSFSLQIQSHVAWWDRHVKPNQYFNEQTDRQYSASWDYVYDQSLIDHMGIESKRETRRLWLQKIEDKYGLDSVLYANAEMKVMGIEAIVNDIAKRYRLDELITHEKELVESGLQPAYYTLRKITEAHLQSQAYSNRFIATEELADFKATNNYVLQVESRFAHIKCNGAKLGFTPKEDLKLLIMDEVIDLEECAQAPDFNAYFQDEIIDSVRTTEFFKEYQIWAEIATFAIGIGAGALAVRLGLSTFKAGFRFANMRSAHRNLLKTAAGTMYTQKTVHAGAKLSTRMRVGINNKFSKFQQSLIIPAEGHVGAMTKYRHFDDITQRFAKHKAGMRILPWEIFIDIGVFTVVWKSMMSIFGLEKFWDSDQFLGGWGLPLIIGSIGRAVIPMTSSLILFINRGRNAALAKVRLLTAKSAKKGSQMGGADAVGLGAKRVAIKSGMRGVLAPAIKMARKSFYPILTSMFRTSAAQLDKGVRIIVRTAPTTTGRLAGRSGSAMTDSHSEEIVEAGDLAKEKVSELKDKVKQTGHKVKNSLTEVATDLKESLKEENVVPAT